jgi:hypothetical protein
MKKQTLISALVLVSLVCVAIAVWYEQFDYDEGLFHSQAVQSGVENSVVVKAAGPDLTVPERFIPLSDPESFDSTTLSDKINGKADVYLESGFVQLTASRFVHATDPQSWFECFVYDMEKPRNAFAVYSVQRRETVTPAAFAEFAYRTENAVFFMCGQYYIEIIGADPSEPLVDAMTEMAEGFIQKYPVQTVDLPERSLLPEENLDVHSIRLILKNAFGYEKFDAIFTGTYLLDGQRITVFLSIRKTAAEAESLAAGYALFLADLIEGESMKGEAPDIPGLQIVDVLGEYELVFSQGNILAGIHGAIDRNAALEVAGAVYRRLKEVNLSKDI